MNIISVVFFGFLLIPLVIFLIWMIKKDKNRNYIGLIVLGMMAIIAIYAIVKFDNNFLESRSSVPSKSQAPSYR